MLLAVSQAPIPASPNFSETPTNDQTVNPRAMKFGLLTCGEQCIFRGQPRPIPRDGAPASSDFGATYLHPNSSTYSEEIWGDCSIF